MVQPIPSSVRKAWDTWNIRVVVLSSLMLQTVLILVAPFRKRTGQKFVILLIWSCYLLADWAADFAVGLISSNKGSRSSKLVNSPSNEDNSDLLAFWAPFLLLHLGGPDTITAFALEDNELWLRHFLGLVFQFVATVYVYIQTLPINKLWIPTMLMFLAGIIKYFERTRSLYLASLGSFRQSMLKDPDPGPNYAKLMEEYSSMKEARLPTKIEMTPEPGKESKDANKSVEEGARLHLCFPAFCKATPNLYLSCRKVRQFFSVQNAIRSLGIEDFLDEWFHVSRERLTWNLWSFIFEELKQKSKVAEDSETAKRICSAKGAYVLREYAYHYHKIFKGLIVDLIPSFRERNESREFFLMRNAEDALKVIEVELNFIYDVLFTRSLSCIL